MTTPLKSRVRLLLLITLVALLALASAPAVLADDDDDDGGGTSTAANRCVVKFVCGEPDPPNGGGGDLQLLRAVNGVYRTAINVLNAGTEDVEYTKKIALTTPFDELSEDFELPGGTSLVIAGTVGMMAAFDVDCNEVFNEFLFGDPGLEFTLGDTFAEGFLILESDGPLDVTAVYTAGNATSAPELGPGGVSSIDVESVKCTQSSSKSDDDDD